MFSKKILYLGKKFFHQNNKLKNAKETGAIKNFSEKYFFMSSEIIAIIK